jgi:acyl carrier protein
MTNSPWQSPSEIEIQKWLIKRVAMAAQLDESAIALDEEFYTYGLDSLAVMTLTGDLEDWLKRPIASGLLYDHPTVRGVSRVLTAEEPVLTPAAALAR